MNTGFLIVTIIIGYAIFKSWLKKNRKQYNLQKFGPEFGGFINEKKIAIGMTKEMVTSVCGVPAKSDGELHKEKFVKEILYYNSYQDAKGKTQYRVKVTYVNGVVTEFFISE